MQTVDWKSLTDIVTSIGITGLAIAAVAAKFRGWWFTKAEKDEAVRLEVERRVAELKAEVDRREYAEKVANERLDEAKRDADEWKSIALQSLTQTERAVNVAEVVTRAPR